MFPSTQFLPLVLCLFVSFGAVAAETANDTSRVRTFPSNGVEIAYLDQGQGDPVVLLQGFGGRLSQWKPMRNALLGAGYRLIAMDSRGHGQSGKPHDVASYGTEMADDVVRLLDHLRIRRAHIIGYSMGGDIANKVRERHPSRLITATMGGVGRGVTKGWTTSDFDHIKIAESLERGEGLKVLFSEPDGAGRRRLSPDELDKMNQRFMKGQDQFALAAVIRAYADLEVSEESLRNNAVPTLVVVGEHDSEKPTVDELKNVMKNMGVEVVLDTDHFTAGVRPEFIRSVLEFLKSHRGT